MDLLKMNNKNHTIMSSMHGLRNINEWVKEFNKLDLKIIKIKRGVEKQWFYPGVEHMMFVLSKM